MEAIVPTGLWHTPGLRGSFRPDVEASLQVCIRSGEENRHPPRLKCLHKVLSINSYLQATSPDFTGHGAVRVATPCQFTADGQSAICAPSALAILRTSVELAVYYRGGSICLLMTVILHFPTNAMPLSVLSINYQTPLQKGSRGPRIYSQACSSVHNLCHSNVPPEHSDNVVFTG